MSEKLLEYTLPKYNKDKINPKEEKAKDEKKPPFGEMKLRAFKEEWQA